jgi:TP901 family phage tail tape measure protein
MATEKELKVKITADTNSLTGKLNKFEKEMGKVEKNFKGLDKVGAAFTSVGSALTKGITLPVVAAGAAASKLYVDFDNSMREVAGTMGITAKEIENGSESYKKLEAAARESGKSTQFSATESAEALNFLALAGYDVDKAIAMLPKTLNLAAAGNLELGRATDMVTDSASALGLDIKGTEVLIDQMARTAQKSNTDIGMLGEGILTVGGTAKMLAGGTTELNTALGILADNGIKGAEGGTALRNVILSLAAPTDKAKNLMKDLGVNAFDSSGKMRPLNEVFKDLDSKLGEMNDSERINVLNTIFNKVDLKSVNALLANSGDRFDYLSNEIANADGTAEQMAETMNSGIGGALKEMKSALEEAGLVMGSILAPVIKGIAEFIKNLSNNFSELSPNVQKFIVVGALLAALLGPIIGIIGSMILAFGTLQAVMTVTGLSFGALALPVLGVVAAIVAVIAIGAFLISHWDDIKALAVELGNKIKETWDNLVSWTTDTYNSIATTISDTWNNVVTWFSDTWNSCSETVSAAWEWITLAVQAGLQLVGDLLKLAFDIITLPWRFIWENVKEYVYEAWDNIKEGIGEALDYVGGLIEDGWNAVMSVTQPIWDEITGWISDTWNGIKEDASEKFGKIKENISKSWNETKADASEKWEGIKKDVSEKWNKMSSDAQEKFNKMKTNINSSWSEVKKNTSDTWNEVKGNVTDAWNNIKDTVKKGVDKLKELVNFHWELPKLKVPKITTSGHFSLNPPSVPSFGITWKSNGGIFRRPTVLGSGYGVGDKHRGAGSNAEAILPINKLPELLGLDKNEGKQLVINIEQFTNNTDADIENLSNRIAWELKRRRVV